MDLELCLHGAIRDTVPEPDSLASGEATIGNHFNILRREWQPFRLQLNHRIIRRVFRTDGNFRDVKLSFLSGKGRAEHEFQPVDPAICTGGCLPLKRPIGPGREHIRQRMAGKKSFVPTHQRPGRLFRSRCEGVEDDAAVLRGSGRLHPEAYRFAGQRHRFGKFQPEFEIGVAVWSRFRRSSGQPEHSSAVPEDELHFSDSLLQLCLFQQIDRCGFRKNDNR